MLVLGSQLSDIAVMSLHTGGKIAMLDAAVINPADLKVIAYKLKGPLLADNPSFLRIADIREMGPLGMIVDGSDDLVGLDDVVKVKELYEINFQLVGKMVIDEYKRKLGKIEDYSIDSQTFMIHKIHVKRGIFRSLTDTGLLIDRSQIVEINPTSIVVKGTAKKLTETVEAEAPEYDFVNPFRKPSSSQPES